MSTWIAGYGTIPTLVTNADRIRTMKDGELAAFIALVELRYYPEHDITKELDKSYDKWLDWLRQEATQ